LLISITFEKFLLEQVFAKVYHSHSNML